MPIRVLNGEKDLTLVAFDGFGRDRYRDLSLIGELDGVAEQVDRDLPEPALLAACIRFNHPSISYQFIEDWLCFPLIFESFSRKSSPIIN
jgi:hypothetical protein